jgi:3-mercaptopyruvate sulfurtransferase SseA
VLLLEELGIKNSRALVGGYNKWVKALHPVEKGAPPTTTPPKATP